MNHRVVHFCAHPNCRERIGQQQHVCTHHWLELPVLLRRALTGSRGAERVAACKAVDDWIKTKAPTRTAPPAFHEPKDSQA